MFINTLRNPLKLESSLLSIYKMCWIGYIGLRNLYAQYMNIWFLFPFWMQLAIFQEILYLFIVHLSKKNNSSFKIKKFPFSFSAFPPSISSLGQVGINIFKSMISCLQAWGSISAYSKLLLTPSNCYSQRSKQKNNRWNLTAEWPYDCDKWRGGF